MAGKSIRATAAAPTPPFLPRSPPCLRIHSGTSARCSTKLAMTARGIMLGEVEELLGHAGRVGHGPDRSPRLFGVATGVGRLFAAATRAPRSRAAMAAGRAGPARADNNDVHLVAGEEAIEILGAVMVHARRRRHTSSQERPTTDTDPPNRQACIAGGCRLSYCSSCRPTLVASRHWHRRRGEERNDVLRRRHAGTIPADPRRRGRPRRPRARVGRRHEVRGVLRPSRRPPLGQSSSSPTFGACTTSTRI